MMAHLNAVLGRLPILTSETGSRRGFALSLGAAILLLPINAQVLLSAEFPSVTCPQPFPLFLFRLLWQAVGGRLTPSWMVIAVPSVTFCLWARPLFSGSLISFRRTLIAMPLVGLGSILWFGGGEVGRMELNIKVTSTPTIPRS